MLDYIFSDFEIWIHRIVFWKLSLLLQLSEWNNRAMNGVIFFYYMIWSVEHQMFIEKWKIFCNIYTKIKFPVSFSS